MYSRFLFLFGHFKGLLYGLEGVTPAISKIDFDLASGLVS